MRHSEIALLAAGAAMLFVSAPARSLAGADSLWARAVSLAEANADWVPGSVVMVMQEVDKHGEPKSGKRHEFWSRLYPGEDGEVEAEIVKVLENGEDVTEERKAEMEEEEKDPDSHTMESYNPFERENQETMKVTATGSEVVVDGRPCAIFEFEHPEVEQDEDGDKSREVTVTGTAWLESGTGVPVMVEYTTDPLPKRVKRMVTTIKYNYGGPDSWYPASLHLEATGGFLFIKKHFHMDMTFSDHWLWVRP
jgi:hypothetical protein